MKKVYVIRKYVQASSIRDALLKERSVPVADCWMEENYSKEHIFNMIKKSNPGFK